VGGHDERVVGYGPGGVRRQAGLNLPSQAQEERGGAGRCRPEERPAAAAVARPRPPPAHVAVVAVVALRSVCRSRPPPVSTVGACGRARVVHAVGVGVGASERAAPPRCWPQGRAAAHHARRAGAGGLRRRRRRRCGCRGRGAGAAGAAGGGHRAAARCAKRRGACAVGGASTPLVTARPRCCRCPRGPPVTYGAPDRGPGARRASRCSSEAARGGFLWDRQGIGAFAKCSADRDRPGAARRASHRAAPRRTAH
jgi:hypothetical protein